MITKVLVKEDPDFVKIAEECLEEVVKMFTDAVEQEKEWADYLFKDGSMIGLNAKLLHDYIEWICCKRMTALGLKCPYTVSSKPIHLTQKWTLGAEVQVAIKKQKLVSRYWWC